MLTQMYSVIVLNRQPATLLQESRAIHYKYDRTEEHSVNTYDNESFNDPITKHARCNVAREASEPYMDSIYGPS